jgi:hypothetical protein
MAEKKVQVTALTTHTHDGKEHAEGDTYSVTAEQAESLAAMGMAKVTDKDAPPSVKTSSPVEPMTTDDFKPKAKK